MKKKIANWGNYPVMISDEKHFSFEEDIRTFIDNTRHLIPRGNGRCYGDASLAATTISTLKYDKVLAFDVTVGIFECQSGLTLDRILDIIVPKGWFLPVTPGTKLITIGGAVGSDVHGKNHHVDGSFSNHILEMDILIADGNTITCMPTGTYQDLFWATCGGMGLTGLITRVRFKLKKIETAYISQTQFKAANLDETIDLFRQHQDATYSVAWIDCLQRGEHFGRSIVMVGEHASEAELTESQRKHRLTLPKKRSLTFPFNLPGWVLNNFTVRAFNFLYYHKNLRAIQKSVIPYEPFFYPLDAIHHWNRGYGKKGFVQYQFVVPLESKQGLIDVLKRISDEGLGSFLAVLKVFGKQDDLISFPTEGYTLALDFPVRKGLFEFLDELDRIVLSYGGRLYMSKDARMKPGTLRTTYPRLEEFITTVKKYNPGGKFRSVQSDRLQLTEQSSS